ncbi:MAG: hypothetical protein H7A23_11630 [Leptospiraceae bacterium]|nr:hypothetical protein [Leptospiraceae bacterium]
MLTIEQDIKEFNYIEIIDINESIKKISDLSFKVRLRALNTLISSNRNESITGFSTLSFELIQFSRKLEDKTEILKSLIYDILLNSTNKKKIDKTTDLFIRANDILILHLDDKVAESIDILQYIQNKNQNEKQIIAGTLFNDIKNLLKNIKTILKLCSTGKTIAMLAKIESAYMKVNKSIYLQLAEDVSDYLTEAETTLKSIQSYILKQYNEKV